MGKNIIRCGPIYQISSGKMMKTFGIGLNCHSSHYKNKHLSWCKSAEKTGKWLKPTGSIANYSGDACPKLFRAALSLFSCSLDRPCCWIMFNRITVQTAKLWVFKIIQIYTCITLSICTKTEMQACLFWIVQKFTWTLLPLFKIFHLGSGFIQIYWKNICKLHCSCHTWTKTAASCDMFQHV